MSDFYQLAALFLLLNIGAGLTRILRGPTTADRLLAVLLFGTTGTAILILLSLESGTAAFQNVALVFALLAGILGVSFTSYAQRDPTEQIPSAESNRELE